jgi:hypothetical protein
MDMLVQLFSCALSPQVSLNFTDKYLSFILPGASLPFSALVMDIVNYRNVCGVFCEEVWQSPGLRSGATIAIMFLQFVLPLIILAYCYGRMKNTVGEREIEERPGSRVDTPDSFATCL